MGGEWRLCYDVGGLGIFGALDGGKRGLNPIWCFLPDLTDGLNPVECLWRGLKIDMNAH